jgi:hypothetical protein
MTTELYIALNPTPTRCARSDARRRQPCLSLGAAGSRARGGVIVCALLSGLSLDSKPRWHRLSNQVRAHDVLEQLGKLEEHRRLVLAEFPLLGTQAPESLLPAVVLVGHCSPL